MDMQKRWDQLLMVGWHDERSIGWCIHKLNEDNIKLNAFLQELRDAKLKRCFARDGSVSMRVPVRLFVNESCKKLSNILWGGGMPILYASKLDKFKWSAWGGKGAIRQRAIESTGKER